MTRKIFTTLISLLMALSLCGTAVAGEATTIFVEQTAEAVAPFPTTRAGDDFMRLRVIALDDNDELATTFNGSPIADATLDVESLVQGNKCVVVEESGRTSTANVKTSVDAATAATKYTFALDSASMELAVSYNLITAVGEDSIKITLKKGSDSINTPVTVDVMAPKANCFVVRTGGLSEVPDPMETISTTQKADQGAIKEAGQSVTVDVMAAYLHTDGIYYFTDQLPECADTISIAGVALASGFPVALAATGGMLESGHLQTTLTIEDLKIPAILAGGLDLGTSGYTTAAGQLAALDAMLDTGSSGDGVEVTFYAVGGGTKMLGNSSGSVGSSPAGVLVTSSDQIQASLFVSAQNDTAEFTPGATKTVTIVGLPYNGLASSGAPTSYSFLTPGGASFPQPSLLDAIYLADNPQSKSGLKAAGHVTTTALFGAIVGFDAYGNPATLGDASGSQGVFELSGSVYPAIPGAQGGFTAVNAGVATTTLTLNYEDQCFLPFRVSSTNNATFVSTHKTTVRGDLYIAGGTNTVASSTYTTVNESNEGVDFILQDYVQAVSSTSASSDLSEAGDDTEIQVVGTANDQSFVMTGVRRKDGKALGLNTKGSTDALSEVAITNSSGNLAKSDVAFFTATDAFNTMFLKLKGQNNSTVVMSVISLTSSIKPADPGDYELGMIMASLSCANVVLDDESGDHNVVNILAFNGMGQPVIMVLDAFGNAYNSTYGSHINNTDVSVAAFKVSDNGSATTEAFPASGDVSNSGTAGTRYVTEGYVEVEYSLDGVAAGDDTAAVVISSKSGAVSGSLKVNAQVMKQAVLNNLFIPVPGINNLPVEGFFADQNGSLVAPVTITSSTSDGGIITMEFEVDNGTTGFSTTAPVNVTTVAPRLLSYVNPSTGKDTMTLGADSDYGDVVLTLTYVPDFEAPVIGTPAAIDCGFTVEITDNIGVDTASSEVLVLDSAGENISSTLSIATSDNGTSGTITVTSPSMVPGTYSATITTQDTFGNRETATKIVTVTSCTQEIGCMTDPAFLGAGETDDLVITGTFTSFSDLDTAGFACDDVTVNSVTVNSDLEVIVNVTIADDAVDQECDVTIGDVTCDFDIVNPGDDDDDDDDNGTDDDDDDDDDATDCELSISPSSFRAPILIPVIRVLRVNSDSELFSARDRVTIDATGVTTLVQIPLGNTRLVVTLVGPRAEAGEVAVTNGTCDGVITLE